MPHPLPPAPAGARSGVEEADVSAAGALARHRHHPVVRGLGAASEIADQVPSVAACGAVLLLGLAAGRPPVAAAGARMLGSVLVAIALKSGIKAVVSRTRPHAVAEGDRYAFEVHGRDGPNDHSFPSGHTSGAVAAARAVARVHPEAAIPALAAAAAIALVQLPRGKHYPADLLAGAAIGVASEFAVHRAARAVAAGLRPAGTP